MQVTVSVPATTANLGPGFDCLGMALNLHNTITAERREDPGIAISVSGEGAQDIPCGPDNLVCRAMEWIADAVNLPLPGITLHQANAVPAASGMGSSSTAIVGGMLTANALLGEPLTREEVLDQAILMEGHPDNVAPAMLGGLILATLPDEAHQSVVQRYDVPEMTVVIVLPEFEFLTRTAREALPETVSMQDAIYNIGRLPLVIGALQTGNIDRLGRVMQDRLHQPYRLPLIPGAESAIDAARQAGAAACAISGAGPSLIAFAHTEHDAIAAALQSGFASAGLNSRAWVLQNDTQGATVKIKSSVISL